MEQTYYRRDKNGITLVSLAGTWREMGRQYGELYREELRHIFFEMLIRPVEDDPEGYANMVKLAETKYLDYPVRLKSFFRGMEESSGLTEEQLMICNAMETVYTVEGMPMCSAMAVWDDYAKDELIFGRNYDYNDLFFAFKDYLSVCVYHPADGSVPTATVGYIGEIYFANGMNANGLFMALNNGSNSHPVKNPERLTSLAQLMQLMLDAPDMEYCKKFFKTVGCSSSYIVGVADGKSARSYEWCTLGMQQGMRDNNGVQVMTNHFTNPAWELETPTDQTGWYTITRRKNLLRMAEEQKGRIDAEAMMKIMSTPIAEGGPFGWLTVYQIVAVPARRTLYIRVVNGADWTEFRLDEVF